MEACPSLTSLCLTDGLLPATFMRALGRCCPLLATFNIRKRNTDPAYLQLVMQLQPSLLPQVRHLVIFCVGQLLPDMSKNTNITSLHLSDYIFRSEAEWLRLPPGLKHLQCLNMMEGPPRSDADGTALLGNLHRLTLDSTLGQPLHALAKLVHATPALEIVEVDVRCAGVHFQIACQLEQSTAADLSVLHGRGDILLLVEASYHFENPLETDQSQVLRMVQALPCMTGVRSCELEGFQSAVVSEMTAKFPDAENLALSFPYGLDDVALKAVASCSKLVSLELVWCEMLTAVGLTALCMRIPSLRSVTYKSCIGLDESSVDHMKQVLREYGLVVEFAEKFDDSESGSE